MMGVAWNWLGHAFRCAASIFIPMHATRGIQCPVSLALRGSKGLFHSFQKSEKGKTKAMCPRLTLWQPQWKAVSVQNYCRRHFAKLIGSQSVKRSNLWLRGVLLEMRGRHEFLCFSVVHTSVLLQLLTQKECPDVHEKEERKDRDR